MALKLLTNERRDYGDGAYVSVNGKLSRLLVYKKAYELIREQYGTEFDFIQVFTDEDRPTNFWLKPCEADSQGARKLDRPSQNSRTLSIRALLKILQWKPAGTVRLPIEWDKEAQAARIDFSQVFATE
jgi:hypothetical protein